MTTKVKVTGGVLEVESMGNGGGPEPPVEPGVPTHPIVLPDPPPGVWPPPTVGHPIQPLPPGDETPPGTIWPSPGRPAHPIYRPRPPTKPIDPDARPEHPIAPGGETPGHPLPQPFWVLAYIPGYGWYYICVDPALAFEAEPPHVDNTLPPEEEGPEVDPTGRRG